MIENNFQEMILEGKEFSDKWLNVSLSALFGVAIIFIISFLVFWLPNKKYTCQGESEDPQNLWLGIIKYAGTLDGYEFRFTPRESRQWYISGHSYHNIYRLTIDDSGEWCGTTLVPNRQPYNLVGHTGKTVYWMSIDITMDKIVCPTPAQLRTT